MRSFFLSITLLFIASLASAQARPGWTPEIMMKFNRVAGTAVSSDGRMVAWTVAAPRMEGQESRFLTHVWIADVASKKNRPLTSGDLSCTAPAFSPDGRSVAFLRAEKPGGKNQLWTVPIDGGEPSKLTHAPGGVQTFAWSPDGARIAFAATDSTTANEEKNRREKRDMILVGSDWKYDRLYVLTVADKTVVRLTEGASHVTAFDWSPDSSIIAFEHRPTPSPDDWLAADISIVPAAGGAVAPLVKRKGSDRFPLWSPDGSSIAFVSDGGEPSWALLSDVYLIPARGGEPKRLSPTPDRSFAYYGRLIGWSPGGKSLHVNEASGTYWGIFEVPLSGPVRRFATDASTFTDVAVSRDGRVMAFVKQASEEAPDIFVTETGRYAPVKISDVNPDIPKFPLAKTVTVTWKSKSGREVEGLLTYPANYVFGNRCPLVLNVHGGPHSHFRQTWTAAGDVYPIQAFSRAGYAMLRPNPRGSSGYGKDFRYANLNDWGYGDFDDLMAGVDHVIALGVAHPDSLCIMGWSYGGYMTAFAVTRTTRFKAASMGAGLSNLSSFTGTSDILSFIPGYFGEIWEHPEAYVKHSAIFRVKEVTTPVLVLHGADDRRVPVSQGYEFHQALKRMGVPTEMVVYPRMPHGLTEPKFILDAGERTIEWFDRCLGRKR